MRACVRAARKDSKFTFGARGPDMKRRESPHHDRKLLKTGDRKFVKK